MVYKKLNSALYLTPKLMYIAVNLEYFIFYGFRHPFFVEKKIDENTISLTFAIMQFVTFFSNMGVAYYTDKIQRPKGVLIGCLLAAAATFQLLFLPMPTYLCCMSFILYSTFILSTVPLLDRIVLEYLQRRNAPASLYGRQRMFGTFTYLVTNYISETLVYQSGEKKPDGKNKENFGNLQMFYLVAAAITSGTVLFLAPKDGSAAERAQAREPPQISKVLKNKAYLFFLLIILLNGITRGVLTVYLSSYYLKILKLESLEVPSSVPGSLTWLAKMFYDHPVSTCSAFGVILEITIFFCANRLVKIFGLYWTFLISQVAQCIRFLSYAMLPVDYPYRFEVACMLELLKGVNFGLTHLSGVQLAVLLVPSNLKSTSQMIYAGTFVCLGGMVGSLMGMYCKITSESGALNMFLGGAALSALAVLLIIGKYGFIDHKLWGAHRAANEEPASRPLNEPPVKSDSSLPLKTTKAAGSS